MAAEVAPNGTLAANLAHAAENAADHLTHFYIFFTPDFAREACAAHAWHEETRDRFAAKRGTAARDVLPARARRLEPMGIFAGSGRIVWPSSRGADVGGPLEQALIGTDIGDAGTRSVAIQHVVRSFDPWMVCTAH
ncbi:Ni,Fe-hydrogenase I large subunit [Bradyrhizobium sp. LM6.10]